MKIDKQVVEKVDYSKEFEKSHLARDAFIRLLKNKGSMIGLIYLIILILLATSASFIFDYDSQVIQQDITQRLISPSKQHIFGTDEFGRDMLARVVHGSRMSLVVSFASVAISLLIGGALGAISGYFGKKIDNIIMRITDVFLAIPMTLFAIVIVAALGISTMNLIIALAVSSIPIFARIVRGAVLTVRDSQYVEAAVAIGASHGVIIWRHILPNCLAPIFVQVTLRFAQAIYNTSALSFLGMGVAAPTPEWGALLSSGRNFIRNYSYLSVIPGVAIMLTILALNLLGDGLRDALDPRLR